MTDYAWQIGGSVTNAGPIHVNGETSGSTPSYTRGEQMDLDFAFWYDEAFDGQDPSGHIRRYEALREYGDFAGSMTVNQSANGVPHYSERIPLDADIDTLVLDFIPGTAVDATEGFWGIVERMDDETRYPNDTCRLVLSVIHLAELNEYADRTALENDLRGGVV